MTDRMVLVLASWGSVIYVLAMLTVVVTWKDDCRSSMVAGREELLVASAEG